MPTSPVTAPARAPALFGEWQRVAAYLRSPRLHTGEPVRQPLLLLARIYLLDMAIMFVLIAAALVVVATGFDLPDTALENMEFTPLLVFGVIVAAPVFEELAFRGWLSGRPGHIFALIALVGGLAISLALGADNRFAGSLSVAAGLAAAVAFLITLRKRGPMAWFERAFPALFWLSTLSFALVHLGNYAEGALIVLLPLVLPQFVLGALLGYVRVTIGLWAAILLHAAHNATALAIASLAMTGGVLTPV